MYDPNDDPDVTSGTTDGALMETTPAPAVRQARRTYILPLALLRHMLRMMGVFGGGG